MNKSVYSLLDKATGAVCRQREGGRLSCAMSSLYTFGSRKIHVVENRRVFGTTFYEDVPIGLLRNANLVHLTAFNMHYGELIGYICYILNDVRKKMRIPLGRKTA